MRISIFILMLFVCIQSPAQSYFQLKQDIPVVAAAHTLLYPWAGGINYPVFSSVDFDGDGLEDLFCFDRSNNRAICFINTGAGGLGSYRYAPEFAEQLPQLRGWALFYDYNCDGKADLFTTGLTNNGIMQFRNDSPTGSLSFTAVDSSMKADYGGGSISNIFASGFLMPHFNDIDGDGDMDVLGQQFFCVGTFAYYKNLSMEMYGVCDSLNKYELNTYAWGRFALRTGAFNNVAVGQYNVNCVLLTPPEGMFGYELAAQDDTYAGIYTLDIDDDGDMDALIGDSGARNSLLVYNGGTFSYADMNAQDTLFPAYDTPVNLNSFTTHAYLDADHDGKKDLLVGHNEFENKRGVMFYKNIGTSNLPVFNYVTDAFLQDEMIDVGEGATPVLFDADADGLLDLIIGNVNSTEPGSIEQHGLAYYRNTGTITNPSFEFVTNDYAGLSTYPITGPLFPAFGDLDGDGDADMLIGHATGGLYRFENAATIGQPASFTFVSASYFGIDVGNFSFPQIIDLNRDGKNDLVIGKKSGVIAYYENTGTAAVPIFNAQPTKDTLGGINVQTPNYVDGFSVPFIYEDSGEYRMLVACMKGEIYRYRGIDGNVLGNYVLQDTVLSETQGIKTTFNLSVSGGDINGDGNTDMLVGIYGGGVQFYVYDTLTMGVAEIPDAPDFIIYPNPVSDYFSVNIFDQKRRHNYQLRIMDSIGRLIRQVDISGMKQNISMAEFSEGVYFVTMTDGKVQRTKRITVIR